MILTNLLQNFQKHRMMRIDLGGWLEDAANQLVLGMIVVVGEIDVGVLAAKEDCFHLNGVLEEGLVVGGLGRLILVQLLDLSSENVVHALNARHEALFAVLLRVVLFRAALLFGGFLRRLFRLGRLWKSFIEFIVWQGSQDTLFAIDKFHGASIAGAIGQAEHTHCAAREHSRVANGLRP